MHQWRSESETGSALYCSFEEMHEAVITVPIAAPLITSASQTPE
jgi:hypothetical protein